MTRTNILLGLGLAIGVAAVRAQGTAAFQYWSGSTEQQLIASVEREAATFPRDPALPLRMKKAFASADMEGSPERKCVAGSGTGPLRSGEFIIGGQLSGVDTRHRIRSVAPKIWWSPLHHAPKMELLVRARQVDRGGGEYRFHGVTVAWGVPSAGEDVPENEREYFFPSGIEFLHSGKWNIVATQGPDWGCFILTLASPIGTSSTR